MRRNQVTEHQKIKEMLDALAGKRANLDVLREEKNELLEEAMTPEIRQAFHDIETRYDDSHVPKAISELEVEIKEATLAIGESVKGDSLHAVWNKQRITWNNPGLEGFAKAHPEILALRKIGKASVSIRRAP